jgi:DNA-binding NtrC family response regulator
LQPKLLIIDDDVLLCRSVMRTVSRQGFDTMAANTAREGLNVLDNEDVDVVLIDIGLPDMSGLELIARARERYPDLEYVVLTAEGNVDVAYEALKAGATEYFSKPITDPSRFMQVLRRCVQVRRLRLENASLRIEEREKGPVDRLLLGNSAGVEGIRTKIRRIARTRADVLILGESGVGKEVVARAIHAESGRLGRFVAINCGSISAELVESELFGHERGSFSGAVSERRGLLQEAADGTVLLDEIGDMPYPLQVKLLRALDQRTFRRVGGSREIQFSGRVVAATNRNLHDMVKNKTFREDLYFRLKVIQIDLPPLRDRLEDVMMLAYYFARQYAQQESRTVRSIEPAVLRILSNHSWPGNVRELRNLIYQLVILAQGETLTAEDLECIGFQLQPVDGSTLRSTSVVATVAQPGSAEAHDFAFPSDLLDGIYKDAKAAAIIKVSRWYLTHVLARAGGNKTRAAGFAGQQRTNFNRLLKTFDVKLPDGDDDE